MFRSCDLTALPNENHQERLIWATLEKPRLDGAAWGRRSIIHVNNDWGDSDDVGVRATVQQAYGDDDTIKCQSGIIYRHSPFSVLGLIGGRR